MAAEPNSVRTYGFVNLDTSQRVLEKFFDVTVPPGMKGGDEFDVIIDGKVLRVTVPPGIHEGESFTIRGAREYISTDPPLNVEMPETSDQLTVSYSFLDSCRLILNTLLVCLCITSFTLPVFSTQYFGPYCNSLAMKKNISTNVLYLKLYDGLCTTTDNDGICIVWDDLQILGFSETAISFLITAQVMFTP